MKTFRRILFATDFSAASRAAWRHALALAGEGRSQLWIVHAVAPLAQAQGARWAYREMEAEIRAGARKRLRHLESVARKAGLPANTLLIDGVPHEAIVRAARAKRAKVIVLGTHGRTGIVGALIGSVAARVVATAPCPVLTVRGRGSRR